MNNKPLLLLVVAMFLGAVLSASAAPTLVSARRSFVDHAKVTVVFSEAVDPASATANANYSLSAGGVNAAAMGVDSITVVLTTADIADGPSPTLTVNGVKAAGDGSTIAPNSQIPVSLLALVPGDLRTAVNGFQDDFEGDTRNPKWINAVGPDVYRQVDGLLQVGIGGGDPKHLVYEDNYDTAVQEILARIRIVDFLGETIAGVAVGIPLEAGTDFSKGMNLLFLNGNTFGGQLGERHLGFLDDYRTFGPEVNFIWEVNTWYWVRLRQEPNTAPGQPDAFAKAWPADGDTPEPTDWQTWDTGNVSRRGFAGFRAAFGGVSDWDVDYALIKATGLPTIAALAKAFATGPVNIVLQPQSQTVAPGDPVTFTVAADGERPYTYQWYRGGSLIAGATSDSYTLAAATPGDNNAEFSAQVSNSFGPVPSAAAKLTVRTDAIPPTLVSARRSFADHTKVTVVFSENVSAATATQAANYKINNGVEVNSAAVGASANTLVLTTTASEEGPGYTLTVNTVQDMAENPIAANSTIAIGLAPLVPTEVNSTVNGFQDDFEAAARNPTWKALGPDTYAQANGVLNVSAGGGDPNHLVHADAASPGTVQEVLALVKMDNFTAQEAALGGVAVGVPLDSLTHDPKGGLNALFLNAGAFGGPGSKNFRFLSDYRGFGPQIDGEWTTGKWYWIRLRQDPNTGAGGQDAFAKVWLADGDTAEPADWQTAWDFPDIRNGFAGFRAGIKAAAELFADYQVDYVLIKAAGLPSVKASPRAFQYGPMLVTQNPQRVRVGAGQQTVTFTVGVEGSGPYSFQWLKNGVPIDAATEATYTIASPVVGDSGLYSVKVNNAFSDATSGAGELIVDVDNASAPTLVSARRLYSDHTKVAVVFSEAVAAASATNPATYGIDNGIVVSGAALTGDNTVTLTTSPIANAPEHKLTVNGVQDLFGNAIAANSQIAIGKAPLVPNDVATPVAGFQDEFDADARDPRWVVAIGPDVYVQSGGYLNVGSGSMDPNHLLFNETYDPSTHEILARIEILTSTGENALGVAAGVPNEPGNDFSKGMNLMFLNAGAFGGPPVPHVRFLDDYRAFGTVLDFPWQKNRWYWMRLRIAPDAGPNGEDAFGKVWPADGDSAEPADWQQLQDSLPALRPGLAGFRATFENRPGTYRVDWALVKAAGLPDITPQPKVFLPDSLPPAIVAAQRGFSDNVRVAVTFSEPLDPGSASLILNYAIDNGVIVSSASLGADAKTVTLITSALGNATPYMLTVNGVQDVAGNAIAANSKAPIQIATAPRQQDGGADGLLVLEAEHFDRNTPAGGTSWELTTTVAGYSGEGALEAAPDSGRNVNIDGSASPRLDFTVLFTKSGTHYVWVRGAGDSAPGPSVKDSVNVGLDGQLPATSDRIAAFPLDAGFVWSSSTLDNAPAAFEVSSPGEHTLSVWMREDGFVIDKLLITSNPAYTPTDAGPGESPRATLDTTRPTLSSARRLLSDPSRVRVIFSEPVLEASATQTGNYAISGGLAVTGAQLDADGRTVWLTTAAPIPIPGTHQLTANGVQDLAGNSIAPNSTITMEKATLVPADVGATVNGFQDDFDAATRDPKWTPLGPDVYEQSVGVLNVHAGGGDPNHLVYHEPAYEGTDTEILARIKVVNFTSQEHAFAGVAVGVPLDSLSLPVKGGMNLLLVNPGAFGGPAQRSARFLNDYTAFGPVVPSFEWSAGSWYWLRLKHTKVSDSQASSFAKVWPADGDSAEPADWQVTWDTPNPRSGLAGLRAGIKSAAELFGDYQVDYLLIKAAGLPAIVPSPAAFKGDTTPPTLASARRLFANHRTVRLTFSEALFPPTATATGNYAISGGVTVSAAEMGADSQTVVLTTSGVGDVATLTVNGVQDLAGNAIAANSQIPISTVAMPPGEIGTAVNGFQDDFDGASRDPNWKAIGPDVYSQANGVLNVSAGGGDPNHLVYADPAYTGAVQEVLARVKIVNFSSQEHALGGVAVGVPLNSLELTVKGGMNALFANPGAFGGPATRHFRFLNDYTGFGPTLDGEWTPGTWYWVRLRQEPNAAEGQPDSVAKVWPAEGDTPEPADWQQGFDYATARSGFAGLRAGIKSAAEVIGDYQVDYVLIKAAGLPSLTPQVKSLIPDTTPPTLVSARRGFPDAKSVTVVISEPVDPASATKAGNYAIDNGIAVSTAVLGAGPNVVVLTTAPIGNTGSYKLTVNGVQDTVGNTIAANSQITIELPPAPRQQDGGADGLLVLEAEHYDLTAAAGGTSWTLTTAAAGFSGDGAMEATPNSGRNVNINISLSPRLDFYANFTTTGTHYVWVRGLGDSAPGASANDSVNVGLDGQLPATSDRISTFPDGAGFVWSNSTLDNAPASIDVTTPAGHLVSVWMREDGFIIDKLVLTTSTAYLPQGAGPEESPRAGLVAPQVGITLQAGTITISWSGTATLQSAPDVTGPWDDVPGAKSPFPVVPDDDRKFYRLKQ